jgi:predicted KAP-like P-loop ATPase
MWSDSDTDIDFLNYSEVAEMVSELIADPTLLPLSLGIFGGWGIGKSSTLRLVERELLATPEKYLIVKFDAWLYQDFDDARAALMGVISTALAEAAPETMKEKAFALLGRVNKLRLLSLAIEGGALAFGIPTFGAVAKGFDALGNLFAGKRDEGTLDALKAAGSEVQSKTEGLVAPAEKKGPPEEIDAFRTEFGEVLKGLNRTLVVFIDNLDRCLPKNAIETLEAARLFLFMPKTAFIVAADEDMIRHAVGQHFSNPSQRHVTDYLDKLIQVPVRVPRAGVQEVRAYLFLLLAARSDLAEVQREALRLQLIERLRQSWSDAGNFTVEKVLEDAQIHASSELLASLSVADRIAPLLALSPGVLGNPRTVKRMLNVVRMRTSVARRRKMPLDEAMITKLALFERCTDSDATEELHNLINISPNGKPALITQLEKVKAGQKSPDLPESWVKHETFILEWAKLDPALADVDLRPAVYLARETVPLRIRSAAMSANAAKAVSTLLQVRSIGSPAAKAALDSLAPTDLVPAMEATVDAMRKNSDWARLRTDFRGATLLADRSDAAAAILVRFFRSLQLVKTPGWVSTMVKDKPWWED